MEEVGDAAKGRLAAVGVEATRAGERRLQIRPYDRWGCPDAIRATRGAPACPSYCSRTSVTTSINQQHTCYVAERQNFNFDTLVS